MNGTVLLACFLIAQCVFIREALGLSKEIVVLCTYLLDFDQCLTRMTCWSIVSNKNPPPPLPFLVPPPFLAKGMRTHPRVHERIFYFYFYFFFYVKFSSQYTRIVQVNIFFFKEETGPNNKNRAGQQMDKTRNVKKKKGRRAFFFII